MAGEFQTIEAELMLLNWQVTATGGAKLVFAISEDDLEPFKSLTRKEGKRPGQRLAAVFVPIGDDEKPAAAPPPGKIGPLCMLAVQWCKNIQFQGFLAATWPTFWNDYTNDNREGGEYAPWEHIAALTVQRVCGIESRKELDTNREAARTFNLEIRGPFKELEKRDADDR
jgi:hypothetical protein